MTAAQALGAVPVPLYQDAVAEEMAYVLDNAEVRFAVVENQEQVDKLLELKERLPRLDTIIYKDPRGMRHYRQTFLHVYADVPTGKEFDAACPIFPARSQLAAASDVAICSYVGHHRKARGVCQTHVALITAACGGRR
jgi:long-chain acyl-CoA synthetase